MMEDINRNSDILVPKFIFYSPKVCPGCTTPAGADPGTGAPATGAATGAGSWKYCSASPICAFKILMVISLSDILSIFSL
jgi:hypothetical protein